MIEVKDLTFSYGKVNQALHGLNFTVEDGKIFGFLGPNGSGRSTTQKILTGILKGHGGMVSLFGKDVNSVHTQDFFQKIGVLFEFPYLYANLSALDNLHYFLRSIPKSNCGMRKKCSTNWNLRGIFCGNRYPLIQKGCVSVSVWRGL